MSCNYSGPGRCECGQVGAVNRAREPFDSLNFIMAYEGGELDDERTIEGFQHLIDSGMAWSLQGHYGRTAQSLIDAGHCKRKS